MANSQEIKKKGPFDFLEKKIVFQISRVFFWVLCAIGGVAFIISLIFFLFNIIPPIKENVAQPPLPPEVTISLAEIEEMIKPPPPPKIEKPTEVAKPTEEVKPEVKEEKPKPPPDPLQVTLEAYIDTLKSYFPADKFTWTTISEKEPAWRDYWGVVREWRTVVKKPGLDRHLYRVLELYSDKRKKIEIVKELIGIISQVPIDNREKALVAYADLRRKKERERENKIYAIERDTEYKKRMAEAKYAAEKMKKAKNVEKSIRFMGGAFVTIAIVGLFLCFLAIERNTRMLQALLEREKKNERA
jgi:hypothetical protein